MLQSSIEAVSKGSDILISHGRQSSQAFADGAKVVGQSALKVGNLFMSLAGERKQLEPLNEEERDIAQKMIDMEHPLKNTLIWVTLPYLKPIRRWLPGFIPN